MPTLTGSTTTRRLQRWNGTPSTQRGAALIAVLLLVLVSLGIGLLSASSSRNELRISHNEVLDMRALAVAEAGIAQAKRAIEAHANLNNELAANATGACNGFTGTNADGVGTAASGLATNIPGQVLAART